MPGIYHTCCRCGREGHTSSSCLQPNPLSFAIVKKHEGPKQETMSDDDYERWSYIVCTKDVTKQK